MIQEDYVSFETAKLLKEKGFDEECQKYYGDYKYPCPTLQMAMKWLREQNKIISILHSYVTNKYRIIITQFDKLDIANLSNTLYSSNDYDYFSYEQACEAGIKYCIENLI